jgi:3-hydroxybutyryl-CoA dehydrogenase
MSFMKEPASAPAYAGEKSSAETGEREFQCVGVVGAGVIGTGVAHLFAQSGHKVLLVDSRSTQLERALTTIRKNARLYGLLHKDRQTTPPADNITVAETLDRVATMDFVIENITEDWELKRAVHEELNRVLKPYVPVAANTSAIPITRFGSLYTHPERVLGMHFMNPVPLMPLVEVIRGERTSAEMLDKGLQLLRQAGRESIVVNDSPGFVTNRVMMLMVNEAMFLVHENVASAQEVDRLFKTCFGHKMGPLETADLIGLDTVLRSLEVIYAELNDSKYRPCPLLRKMVYAGRNGRKSNEGFYTYEH